MNNLYSLELIDNLKHKIKIQTIIMILLSVIMISFDIFCFIKVNYYSKTLYTALSIVISTLIIWVILSFIILRKYYKNDINHYNKMISSMHVLVTGIVIKSDDVITLENDRKCRRITISIDNKECDYYLEEFLLKNELTNNNLYNLYIVNRYVVYYERCD